MLVDWVTVIAQAVNFLVLVFLLQRLLYKPITTAMAERRNDIEAQLAAARQTQAEAEELISKYEGLQREQIAQHDSLLAKARSEAEQLAIEMRDEARREVGALKERWQDALSREQESFWREFEDALGREVYLVAAAVLEQLASAELHEQVQQGLLERLAKLPDAERERLAELASGGETEAIVVLSAQPPDERFRGELAAALGHLAGANIQSAITWETQPALLAGTEIRGSGWKIGWSLRGYLEGLRNRLRDFLAEYAGDAASAANDAAEASRRDGKEETA